MEGVLNRRNVARRVLFSRLPLSKTCVAIVAAMCLTASANPAEDAFAQVWAVHRNDPADHAVVIARCKDALQRRSGDVPVLANYQPVVQTLMAWHLLAHGNTNEAMRAFETVLSERAQISADPIVRTADALARRWLTRIDHAKVTRALLDYYAANVSYPSDLNIFKSYEDGKRPPLSDRFGDAWFFKGTHFKYIKTASGQRYDMYSVSLGKELSNFSKVGKHPFPALTFVRRGAGTPVMLEFSDSDAPADAPVSLVVGGVSPAGLRLVAVDGAMRFALLSDSDFWIIAMPKGK